MCLVVVMDFSLDSLDGFPGDSDILEASQEHVTDLLTSKTSPKACVKSKDKENAIISATESNRECDGHDTSAETKQREGRIDSIESQTAVNEPRRVPESNISLRRCPEKSSDFTRMKYERSPSSICSTHEIADFAISQEDPKHGRFGLKFASNCTTPNSLSTSQTDQREDLPQVATPTRGDNFVGVVSHHHDLSPWERWVVQKARQEREKREGKRLSDVSNVWMISFHGNLHKRTQ
jgi:hypothetical protein